MHLIAFALLIMGATVIYCNDNFRNGLLWLNAEKYDDSPAFKSQFNNDISLLFSYVGLKSIFETDGRFDINKDVFGLNMGPSNDVDFSVGSIIEYAKRHGYYIDEHFKASVVNRELVDQVENTSYYVNYRTYAEDTSITEPGEAYISMKDVIVESLNLLATYYEGYERFVLHPSNFKYKLEYGEDVFTNDRALTALTMKDCGKYATTSSQDLIVNTNLKSVPRELSFQAEKLTDKLSKPYRVIIALDTSYSANDPYSLGNTNYIRQRRIYLIGMSSFTIGMIFMTLTLACLIMVSGHLEGDKVKITSSFDAIPFEVKLLLLTFIILVWATFNNLVGRRIVHIYFPEKYWDVAGKMLNYIGVYIASLPIGFSILREFKAGILWKNSYTKLLKESMSLYMLKRTFSKRIGSEFLTMILVDFLAAGLLIVVVVNAKSLVGRFVIFVGFVIFAIVNLLIFNKAYKSAVAVDKIAEAIKEIAKGDTGYKLEEGEFNGKEADIAKDINNISKGLQSAINDQVKSERLKADLITNVSHDIKTPLTSIINYVDLIKREKPENEKIREYLDVLSVKSQHLKNLTEDLVEASKVSSGNVSVDIDKIDFVEMINQTNGEFEEKFKERGLSIISNLPKESVNIKADGRHLWRVLENLYNNVFKYAVRNSRIYIDIGTNEGKAMFVIKNISESPLNISPDELTERFVRGDISRATEGSGLGLSIAKSLTLLQGGEFEIIIDGDLFKVKLKFDIADE